MYGKKDRPLKASFNCCSKSAGVLEIQQTLARFGCEDVLGKYSILLNFTIFHCELYSGLLSGICHWIGKEFDLKCNIVMEVLKESVSPVWVFDPLDIRSTLAFWRSLTIRLTSLGLRLWFRTTFSWGHGGESEGPEFLTFSLFASLDLKRW